jgi:signal transduction histidine kinase
MLKHELNVLIGVAATVALAGVAIPAGFLLESFYRHTAIAEKGATMGRVLAPPLATALEKPGDKKARVDDVLAGLPEARDAVGDARIDLESYVVLDAQNKVVATSFDPGPGAPAPDLSWLTQDRLVERARVETEHDVLMDYPKNKWGKDGEALVAFAVPLRKKGGDLKGVLWYTLSLERARWVFWQTFVGLLAGIAAGAIAVWFVLYKALKFRILHPVVLLTQAIEKVRQGDLGARVQLARQDEFGTLIASFNDMVAMLREKPLIDAKLSEAERIQITNQRLAESHQRLADAHAELQAAKEALALREKQASFQRFVRSIAHELKNPLNSANAAIEPLSASLARLEEAYKETSGENPKLKEDQDDVTSALGILRRSVGRAVSIIHDLQGFAQLGEADLVTVDLRRIVEDAALSVKPLFGERIELELDIPGEVNFKAFPTLLAQAFVNLFTNAGQAILGRGTVSVSARKSSDRVHIEVRDTGPGIPAENIPKLFEPFFTTKGVAGTGLGLALTYAYVEKHGGTIEARSDIGKGATFIIDVPLEPRPTGGLGPKASAIFDTPRK